LLLGICVFLGDNLLSWFAKHQVTLSRSNAEAEYRGVANAIAKTTWIHNLLRELHTPLFTATLIYCDNVSAVYMSANLVQHQHTKLIKIDIHFVHDYVASGQVRVLHVPSQFQYADIFTKGLSSALFLEFCFSLNVRRPPILTTVPDYYCLSPTIATLSPLYHEPLITSVANVNVVNRSIGTDNAHPGTGPNWLFDIDSLTNSMNYIPVSARNQTDKNVGPQDTNGNADDKPKDGTGSKTIKEPVNKEDQVYRDALDRLMSQEKEASDATDFLSKEFEQGCMDQRGATKAGSTNQVNIVSNPVNAASTSGTFSDGGPSSPNPDAFIHAPTLLHVEQDDSQIPDLEDTAILRGTSIFNSAYDDDLDIFTFPVQSVGVEADFSNMESSTVVSPIPTHIVHMDHPKDQIPGDP
nr:NBS-containing resistance-like protein [Tanacetum cinerariifolium]